MNKKLIAGLALTLVLGSAGSIEARDIVDINLNNSKKVEYLIEEDLVKGYSNGNLALEKNISRAEIVKLIVQMKNQSSDIEAFKSVVGPFKDVDKNHWANGFINIASKKLVDGKNPIIRAMKIMSLDQMA